MRTFIAKILRIPLRKKMDDATHRLLLMNRRLIFHNKKVSR